MEGRQGAQELTLRGDRSYCKVLGRGVASTDLQFNRIILVSVLRGDEGRQGQPKETQERLLDNPGDRQQWDRGSALWLGPGDLLKVELPGIPEGLDVEWRGRDRSRVTLWSLAWAVEELGCY